MSNFIFITGEEIDYPGKSFISASMGKLLENCGLKVSIIKLCPEMNVNIGGLNPLKWGEIFITADGFETHRDIGHYERILNREIPGANYISLGKMFMSFVERQNSGDFNGDPLDMDTHIPREAARLINGIAARENPQVIIIDIGGYSGETGHSLLLKTLWLIKSQNPGETLTVITTRLNRNEGHRKPGFELLRNTSRHLNDEGIRANIVLCCSENPPDYLQTRKIAELCYLDSRYDVFPVSFPENIYQLTGILENQKLDDSILKKLDILTAAKKPGKTHDVWEEPDKLSPSIRIGILGSFPETGDFIPEETYASLLEALRFSCRHYGFEFDFAWIDAKNLNNSPELIQELYRMSGIVVPDIHYDINIEGVITGIRNVRIHKIPFLGLRDGMALAVVDIARTLLKLEDAHSTKFSPKTPEPLFYKIADLPQKPPYYDQASGKAGTYPVTIKEGTGAADIYKESFLMAYSSLKTDFIKERHRCRYVFNENYRKDLEEIGLVFSGNSHTSGIAEIIEIPCEESEKFTESGEIITPIKLASHPFFMGVDFFPEFQAKPSKPHPLFREFIRCCAWRSKPVKSIDIIDSNREPDGISPLAVELGTGLHPLIDPAYGAKLVERFQEIRRHIFKETGLKVPKIDFYINRQLKPNAYVIKIHDIEFGMSEVFLHYYFAICPEDKLRNLKGIKANDPTYGLPGIWISKAQRADAECLGCMIFDSIAIIATKLTEVIRSCTPDLLDLQGVQDILDELAKTKPAVVEEFYKTGVGITRLIRILKNLLRERVSIRHITTILDTIIANCHVTQDVEILTECIRVALSRIICRDYINNEGVINVISIDPYVERLIAGAVKRSEGGSFLALDPNLGQEILARVGDHLINLQEQGLQPIILVAPQIRTAFKKLTERSFPSLVVLSWNEIAPGINVTSVGMVSLGMDYEQWTVENGQWIIKGKYQYHRGGSEARGEEEQDNGQLGIGN